jgi:hypothetical protein
MTDEDENAELVSIAPEPSHGVFSFSVLGAAIATGLVATGSMLLLAPPLSWGIALGASLAGGVTSAVLAGVPRRQGEAALLRERAAREEERKSWGAAVVDLESLRRQINLATLALRGRKDPLVELPELRVGALHDLLEASRDVGVAGPVVSRIAVDEAELVGDMDRIPGFLQNAPLEGFDPHPSHTSHAPAPAPVAPVVAPAVGFDPRLRREALQVVDSLIQALEQLGEEIESVDTDGSVPAPESSPSGSPAQLVDSVVQTAANGIEDLAAGLMRANELATVAERVTNRATLLALNAQLEATRSGGEAMGAIAEETRRLSEYAREATDTISRLADEIEAKVGETITAIHATSEDAKAGIAAFSTGASSPPPALDVQRAIEAVVAALDKAYDLRARLEKPDGSAAEGGSGSPPASTPQDEDFAHSGGAAYAASLSAHPASVPSPSAPPPSGSAQADTSAQPSAGAEVTWAEPAWADAVESLTPEQRQILERLQPELKRDTERRG